MSIFIKGDAVTHAKSYKLYKIKGDEKLEVATISPTKLIRDFNIGGIVLEDGSLGVGDKENLYTDFIPVDSLADDENTNVCVNLSNLSYGPFQSAVFYEISGSFSNACDSMSYNQLKNIGFKAEAIKSYAEESGAKYVVFNSKQDDAYPFWVCVSKGGIFFDLNDYADALPAGEIHYLVVKAIAPTEGFDTNDDGTIDTYYADSDYGGDASGNPLEYVAGTIYTNDASKWVQQSISTAGALSYPGDTGFNRSNIMAVEKFAAGETITVISKSERLMVALVSYDANGAFASRGSWVGLDPTGVNGDVSTTFTSENQFNVVIATNSETNYTLEQMLNIVTVIGNK